MKGIGQSFDEFMQEQGLYYKAKELAAKQFIVLQLAQEMKRQQVIKTEIAKRMNTSLAFRQ